MKERISRYIFQFSIGLLFGYFGLLALMNPSLETAKWVSPWVSSVISLVMPIDIFVVFIGVLQIVVATLLIVDRFVRHILILAALIIFGIIVNLGLNEIAFRDVVIFSGILYLYFSQKRN